MKIEVKNIHHSARLSEETYAYSADVYVDGKLLCKVSNHGTGGPDETWPAKGRTHADIEAVDAWCKANLPKHIASFNDEKTGKPFEMGQDLEMVCHDAVTDFLTAKDLKRTLATKFAWEEGGKIWHVKKPKGNYTQEQIDKWLLKVKEQNKVKTFLNDMPFPEALAIVKKAA
jgi:hypothetical protein